MLPRSRHAIAPAAALLVAASIVGLPPVRASVIGFSSQDVDLARAPDARQKTAWSDPDRIQVHDDGLGWGTSADQGSQDFWLQTTEPIALGESWRPPRSANVRVAIEHMGQPGTLYVRYSPDAKHWSNWQVLAAATPRRGDSQGQHFQGQVRIPYREQQRYSELLQAYGQREDVPWGSDEEAFVKELVARETRFFRQQIPFVGYVQFLYETQLHGGERIKGLKAEVAWGIGGVHAVPRDSEVYKDRGGRPWRFKAD